MSLVAAPLEPVAVGQMRFRIHGPEPLHSGEDDDVSAWVFAAKLGALVSALKAADKAVNGRVSHDYKISRLTSSSPTVLLSERQIFSQKIWSISGIEAFSDCVAAIGAGDREGAKRYGKAPVYISRLAKGSRKTFSYAEVWGDRGRLFRVDDYLVERSEAVLDTTPLAFAIADGASQWFVGVAVGSFDGKVRAVDLRGDLPEIKLILSAGGKQINCVFGADDIETLRSALDRRVRVTGTAIYDGRSGLPRRIERPRIDMLDGPDDFARWKASFEPFEIDPWIGDGQ